MPTNTIATAKAFQKHVPAFITRAPIRAAALSHFSVTVQYFRHLDRTPLAGRENAGADHCERSRRLLAPDLVLALPARRCGKLLEFLDQRIVTWAWHRNGMAFTALEQPQPIMHIVECRHVLAVDIHQVVLGRRGVARVQRRKRAVLMLQ